MCIVAESNLRQNVARAPTWPGLTLRFSLESLSVFGFSNYAEIFKVFDINETHLKEQGANSVQESIYKQLEIFLEKCQYLQTEKNNLGALNDQG